MSSEQHSKHTELQQKIDSLKSGFKDRYVKTINIDEKQIKQRKKQGKALIDKDKIKIDGKFLEELSGDFWQILKDYSDLGDKEGNHKKKINIEKLTRLVLAGDLAGLKSLARKINLQEELLLFLGSNLAQAILGAYAYKLQEKVDNGWLKEYCPICGSSPCMGKFAREDGKRILYCQFCGTQWVYRRIMCPFCGNDDHNSLRYFFTEENSPYRVDVCDKCKRYIKGIDERKLPEGKNIDLSFEYMNTLYLDVLAQKDGYQNPVFWMMELT